MCPEVVDEWHYDILPEYAERCTGENRIGFRASGTVECSLEVDDVNAIYRAVTARTRVFPRPLIGHGESERVPRLCLASLSITHSFLRYYRLPEVNADDTAGECALL